MSLIESLSYLWTLTLTQITLFTLGYLSEECPKGKTVDSINSRHIHTTPKLLNVEKGRISKSLGVGGYEGVIVSVDGVKNR